MTTVSGELIALPNHGAYDRMRVVSWEGMTTGDIGEPVDYVNLADRSVVGLGSFNGATLRWEAFIGNPRNSTEVNDDNFWLKLTDPSDNFLEMTEAKIEAVSQVCVLIRPRVVGGTAPSITARLAVKE